MTIGVRSPEWLAVIALVEQRIAALTQEAMGTAIDDRTRRDLVMRVDELRLLLATPADEAERARARMLDAPPTTSY